MFNKTYKNKIKEGSVKMKIGYARVSTREQNLDMQMQSLRQYGCEKIFFDKKSGRNYKDRKEFVSMLSMLREGDELVCWKMDRLGRNAKDLWEISSEMKDKGVTIVSLSESINTSTVLGEMFCKVAALFAEIEISNHSERTREGLLTAKRRGVRLGRPKGVTKKYQRRYKMIKILHENGMPVSEITKEVDVSSATVYRYIKNIKSLREK